LAYAPWFIREAPQDSQWRSLQFVELRPHKDQFVAKIAGLAQREDLQAFRGAEIGVLASVLPAPEPNEYYWRDLMGLEVINLQGFSLGMVSDVMETGAHDLLVVSKGPKQRLIPFVAQYIQAVSLARIEVDWLEDWD
jgi:16S rRNA processing protein RimM